ncbi:GM19851 [Drosophila sechellia]|uniref:GM19851 n=1 Tax=Drosophila sechellia TaxID=7238 RepID=B4HPB6_DROSE|nr:GM19851 [Drosophila sechellia]
MCEQQQQQRQQQQQQHMCNMSSDAHEQHELGSNMADKLLVNAVSSQQSGYSPMISASNGKWK